MTTPSYKRLVTVAAAAALLAACSGNSQSGMAPIQSMPDTSRMAQAGMHGVSLSALPAPMGLRQRSTGNSWISPDATKSKALLYVNEIGNGTVNVYRYTGGNPVLKGTFTGYEFPTPPCTDNKGDVFVPDYDAETITEYAYGKKKPMQVLSDAGYFPFGCSVDPATGNLAVADFGSAAVSIFPGATGTPTVVPDPGDTYVEYVAYDNSGNLFAAGRNTSSQYMLGELEPTQTSFSPLVLSGASVAFPGQIEWGGDYLLVGDQGPAPSYVNQVTVSGGTATFVNKIALTGSDDIVAGYKRGSAAAGDATYAGPDYGYESGYDYSFPGGAQIGSFSGSDGAYGGVIAQKK